MYIITFDNYFSNLNLNFYSICYDLKEVCPKPLKDITKRLSGLHSVKVNKTFLCII